MPEASEPSVKADRTMRLILFVLGGAVAGFLYYRFVGCRTGACALTGNPFIATFYGAFVGLLLARP
jgi:hypothetical protein